MNHKLANILQEQIKAAGQEGFEGLIAKLLEKLTGHHFYLAKSGSQEGRDLSSRTANANVIAVECKRYKPQTALGERDLSGEIVQVTRSIPDLDIWVLVTSRDVDSILNENLLQEIKRRNIEFVVIADDDSNPSTLEALCANSSQTVIDFLQANSNTVDVAKIQGVLDKICAHNDFSIRLQALKDKLLSPLIGYENWRISQNRHLLSCFKSEADSRRDFGQPINVTDETVHVIKRTDLSQQLTDWYESWTDKKSFFALLGEEGDGKTWGAAQWIGNNLQSQKDFPPVVFMSSLEVRTNEPDDLISEIINRRLKGYPLEQWKGRVNRWIEHREICGPLLFLVLDGINERHKPQWWRRLLEKLSSSPWFDKIAVIITCRQGYWQRNFQSLSNFQFTTWAINPYNDSELEEALRTHQLSRAQISDSLLALIRKPRYFDLTVKYRQQMADSGDMTPARLVYEDWKDRHSRKSNMSLNSNDFESFIRNLAERYIQSPVLNSKDIADNLPLNDDQAQILEELRTGGILRYQYGRLQVDPKFLQYGFALLLVDELEQQVHLNEKALEEVIAEWLEPHSGMDIKAEICHFASLIALHRSELSKDLKVALLQAWVFSQNPSITTDKDFIAYLPLDPKAYVMLAEIVWSDAYENPWAQELVMQAFMRWKDHENVLTTLTQAFERWLGFVHRFGFAFDRQNQSAEELHNKINERISQEIPIGEFSFCGNPFTAIEDDGLLRLGRVALGIISLLPKNNFIRAVTLGCLADAIMDYPSRYDLFQWVISTSQEPIADEIKSEVKQLISNKNLVALQAAHSLLSFEGSNNAYQIQQTLQDDLFPINPQLAEHMEDPCNSWFQWSEEDCKKCLTRTDLAPYQIVQKISNYCLNPDFAVPEDLGDRLQLLIEEISVDELWSTHWRGGDDIKYEQCEAVLCAYIPQTVADKLCNAIQSVQQRTGENLRQLCFHFASNYLIFTNNEHEVIRQAWQEINAKFNDFGDLERIAEARLFWIVLKNLDPNQQLNHFYSRSEELIDFTFLEKSFKSNISISEEIKALLRDGNQMQIQRILSFLAKHPKNLHKEIVQEFIYHLINHTDSFIRSIALKILFGANIDSINQNFLNRTWKWDLSYHEAENYWGSYFLCKYASSESYATLSKCIHPAYIGYLVSLRGTKEAEICEFINYISQAWNKIYEETFQVPDDLPLIEVRISRETSFPNYTRIHLSESYNSRSENSINRNFSWGGYVARNKSDSDLLFSGNYVELNASVNKFIQQQNDIGNFLIFDIIPVDVLSRVVVLQPQLVEQWLKPIAPEQDPSKRKVIHLASAFYECLCAALFNEDHSQAQELYDCLQSERRKVALYDCDTKISFLDYALLCGNKKLEIENLWQQRIKNCRSDLELLEILIVFQQSGKTNWLQSYIENSLGSLSPREFSFATTVLGFIDDNFAAEKLTKMVETLPDTWRGKLASLSLERWQKNSWAKHWFAAFLNESDAVVAWSRFRLFLHCVDRRYWLWEKSIINGSLKHDNYERNLGFLEDNIPDVLRHSIQKNENSLKQHFLGQKIAERQAWPWLE
jgi:hypothetical protein